MEKTTSSAMIYPDNLDPEIVEALNRDIQLAPLLQRPEETDEPLYTQEYDSRKVHVPFLTMWRRRLVLWLNRLALRLDKEGYLSHDIEDDYYDEYY